MIINPSIFPFVMSLKKKAMLTIIVENCLWCTWAACFIRMNNLAERVHQRPLKQQQYCLTKPKRKKPPSLFGSFGTFTKVSKFIKHVDGIGCKHLLALFSLHVYKFVWLKYQHALTFPELPVYPLHFQVNG